MTFVNKDNNNVEGTVNNFVIKKKGITLKKKLSKN
jgi:hypothetical protein